MPFFVYLVECGDKTYYCGCTKDINARLVLHNKGKAAKYTRARLPVRLAYLERKKSMGEALRREAEIKSMGRKQKKEMIAGRKPAGKK